MLNLDLTNRVVVVSGGSQGVGRGLVLKIAEAGAKLVILHYDADDTKLNETLDLIKDYNTEYLTYKVNVTDHMKVREIFADVKEKFGYIDCLVNNAGVGTTAEFIDLTYEEIDFVLDVNLKGVFTLTKEVLPYLIENNFGRIINISSTSMYTGGGGGAHYAASKSGLLGMMRNISKTYAKYNITTNNLAISLLDTEMFRKRYPNKEDRDKAISTVPVKRAGTPEDVAYMVCFILSDWSGYINGTVIELDGGRLYA